MAKADIRKSETDTFYAQLGGCMDEVRGVFRMTLQEFSAAVGKDERQLKRQIEGKERPQLEAVFAIEKFRGPLLIAMARLATGVEVDTVIHVRRTA